MTKDGDVYAWGYNGFGQLGLGNTLDIPVATLISFFKDNNIKIKEVITPYEGYSHYCQTYFLSFTGEVYSVGHNGFGQLGDGTTINKNIPVRCGFLSKIKKVVASCSYYTSVFALDENGELWAWGYNGQGQLGFGDTTGRTSPNKISSISDIIDVLAVGGHNGNNTIIYNHTIALTKNGKVYSCGSNFAGQLGHGDLIAKTGFVQVQTDIIAKQIFFGGSCYGHLGILDEANKLYLCGVNDRGELGLGDVVSRTILVKPNAGFQGNVAKVGFFGSHGESFTIVLDKQGKLWGAGYNGNGQLGLGNSFLAVNNIFKPLAFYHHNLKIVDFQSYGVASETGLFALAEDGRVMACGYNGYGGLGTQSANLHRAGTLETVLF